MPEFCAVGYSATLARAQGHNFKGYLHWGKVLAVEGFECTIKWQTEKKPSSHSITPPLSFPTPCRSPGGGGGPSLGQPKIFRYGSLCCCVGDCVVGYCHLYPLYSWQDILLTFAEWNLTAQPCFPLGQM